MLPRRSATHRAAFGRDPDDDPVAAAGATELKPRPPTRLTYKCRAGARHEARIDLHPQQGHFIHEPMLPNKGEGDTSRGSPIVGKRVTARR